MPRYTCVEDGSSKFWEGSVEGSILLVRFGRIGTEGQAKDKDMGSPEAAQKELARLIREKVAKGYVEEPAGGKSVSATRSDAPAKSAPTAPSPATAPAAAAKASKDAGKYPFLFYGALPTDWAEGANGGHVFDVRFATAPSAAARLAVAETYEKICHGSEVDPDGEAWLWAGDWALVNAGEGDGGGEDFFKDMQKALKAVHEVAPIAEVIYWGVQEDDGYLDKWTKWTLSQQKKPTPEPKYPGQEPVEYFEQSVDGSIGRPVQDSAFEECRESVRIRLETGPGPEPGHIGLVALDKKTAPRPAPLSPEVRGLFDSSCTVYSRNGSVVAVSSTGKLFFIDAKGERQTAKAKGTPANPVFADDGKLVFFSAQSPYQERTTRIYQLSLPDGKCDEIWHFPMLDEHAVAVPVGDDRLAILVSENLLLVGREDGAEYDQKAPVDGYSLNGVHGGDLIFLQSSAMTKPVFAYRTTGGKLKQLGRIGPNFWQTWQLDGHYYGGQPQEGGKVFEILNVDEALTGK